MNQKWLNTTDIFEDYERRFCQARLDRPRTCPWRPEDRERIKESTRQMLRYDENLVPTVHNMEEVSRTEYDGYTAIQLRYETWDKMYGASTLYLPHKEEKLPLVFVCCGHGDQGRLSRSYMGMGHRLASLGMAAIVMDNIGQGDRNPDPGKGNHPDHWLAIAPFRCGLTLQGLIVMETVAMIRCMQKDPRFDTDRFGACGNSGGGTLTMFLAALAPELSVIASSGYPSEVAYLLQKERRHCACNLLIGQAQKAEMWEIYSLFAPKPMLLSGGVLDNLIPMDIFLRNGRKVRNTYVQMRKEENFTHKLTKTQHPWDVEDVNLVSAFLSRHLLGVTPEKEITEIFEVEDLDPLRVTFPTDRLNTAQLSEKLTGRAAVEGEELADVFVPIFQGKVIDPDEIQLDVGRGDVMRVFAQFECSLYKEE